MKEAQPPPSAPTQRLGTFLGVFTPTLLTILGVIMYLRFGWVLGNVGLLKALLIVALANGVTLITTLSVAAEASNTRVGVGGAYYIISRGLGLEIGGAIGLPLYLSQVFSVTLYSYGLAESLRIVWPDVPLEPVAIGIILLVSFLSLFGAKLALKTQLPVMVAVGLSLLALAWGALNQAGSLPLPLASHPESPPFWTVFAIFFPAVTGVMAGLGLSGDLEDPQTALPKGSIWAVLVGFAVYMSIPFLLVTTADVESLRNDPLIWTKIAPLGALLILPGLWGAIFSSAVGSILTAPRTLQALAMDRLVPRVLGRVSAGREEPLIALAVSTGLALAAVFLGSLDAVAVTVTIFFLTTYGAVNLVTGIEIISGDPSWRPRLSLPLPVPLLGAVACFGVMFLISPVAGFIAIITEIGLWIFLRRRGHSPAWGDARRGLYEALIRWALIGLSRRPMTSRNWRPHILIFADDIDRRLPMVQFGLWLSQERGVVTVCELLLGDLLDENLRPEERLTYIGGALNKSGFVAFAEVNVVRNFEDGIVDISQANGMAGLHSNMILFGWTDHIHRLAVFLSAMRRLERIHKSVAICRSRKGEAAFGGQRRRIDIWWGGLQRNGDLMLLLAHLLTQNPEWSRASIRIKSIAASDEAKQQTEANLDRLLGEIRIKAETSVIRSNFDRSVPEMIRAESTDADLVILGLATPYEGGEEAYARQLVEMVQDLPTVLLVRNSSLFVGELV